MTTKWVMTGRVCKRLLAEEAGQDMIEYALVAGLIGLAAVVSLRTLTTRINTLFTEGGAYLVMLVH